MGADLLYIAIGLVSLKAAVSRAPEIALGNVVGSNIANILLVIGAGAVIMPVVGWDIDPPFGKLL